MFLLFLKFTLEGNASSELFKFKRFVKYENMETKCIALLYMVHLVLWEQLNLGRSYTELR